MTPKRQLDNGETPEKNRPRGSDSSANSMRELMMIKSMKNIGTLFEPWLRRVVHEELDRGIRAITRRNDRQLQEFIEAPKLRLMFKEKLALPIFTSSNIEAQENTPLEIVVMDVQTGTIAQQDLPPSIKVEILVLDGDFPPGDGEDWTSAEFNSNVVRRRDGKRPLLSGDVSLTLKDGVGLIRDLAFTDNSSWTRSRKFRLGARVLKGSNAVVTIGEALSEAFTVRDHRGESYKKHHPPSLNDEVWRLEKIGKDGAFHKRLAAEGINTVRDFLRLSIMDSGRLRRILGPGTSDKMWEVTLEHAKECELGQKMYFHHDMSQRVVVTLNSICQPVAVLFDGSQLPITELNGFHKAQVEMVVKDAYNNWHKVKEVDASRNTNMLPSTSDFNGDSAADSLNPATSALPQCSDLLEALDQGLGPSCSKITNEFQFQNSVDQCYIQFQNSVDQTQNSACPSRNIEEDHLQNFYNTFNDYSILE